MTPTEYVAVKLSNKALGLQSCYIKLKVVETPNELPTILGRHFIWRHELLERAERANAQRREQERQSKSKVDKELDDEIRVTESTTTAPGLATLQAVLSISGKLESHSTVKYQPQDVNSCSETQFESGIGSMPDVVSMTKEQDEDKRSIRSMLTTGSRVRLPPHEEKHLVSPFVEGLCQDIVFSGDDDSCDRISARLPDLLNTFTLKPEENVNSKPELDAKKCIRQQRNCLAFFTASRITHQFREHQMLVDVSNDEDSPVLSDVGMSPAEKMAFWNSAEPSDFLPLPKSVEQALDESQEPPRYQEVRSFLLGGPANEQGLELPFDMVSILAEARYATSYDTAFVLKGLCTMLVPTNQIERSITWHFILNEYGQRLPYYSFRERCPGWVGTDKVSIDILQAGNIRNFVGWVTNITRHLVGTGAEELNYGEVDWAGPRECSPGLAIEQKLTISVSKIVGGSGSVVRGNKDKPLCVQQSSYSMQITNAREMGTDSLFNNVASNGSTFKHLAIDGGPNAAMDILKEDCNMKHIILREFDSYSDGKTVVLQFIATLATNVNEAKEQIYGRQIEVATSHTTKELQNPLRTTLEGYEFMDIVSGERIVTRRTVSLQLNGTTWADLTRQIHAITFFGQHFGDIYKPT
ncbi:hypothetical protein BKA64DRAFT_767047 [Cadophora sp. MPI-SDFR-AT-0126]|nr:hypothetical protein BKA64DRAFT_767047 [Leotiomycetes sp. MPI-SDFR-AT-0126]